MKSSKFRLFCLLLAVPTLFNLTSCDDDDDNNDGNNKLETVTIDFENVDLGTIGYWDGSDLSGEEKSEESYGTLITNYYGYIQSGIGLFDNVYTSEWSSWIGFSCSSLTDKERKGSDNQYSVYANGGADNSQKFALAFSSGASFKFSDDQEKTISGIMINNSTYVYYSLSEGDIYGAKKFENGDWFKVTFTGYDAQEKETGSKEFFLADFQNGKTYICKDWTNVDLSALGKVNKVVLSFSSTDNNDYGMLTPAYVCLDNLVYIK